MVDLRGEAGAYGRRVGDRVRGVMSEYGVHGQDLAAALFGADGKPRSPSYVSRRLTGRDIFTVDELYIVAAMCNLARPDFPPVTLVRLLDVASRTGTVTVTGGYLDIPQAA